MTRGEGPAQGWDGAAASHGAAGATRRCREREAQQRRHEAENRAQMPADHVVVVTRRLTAAPPWRVQPSADPDPALVRRHEHKRQQWAGCPQRQFFERLCDRAESTRQRSGDLSRIAIRAAPDGSLRSFAPNWRGRWSSGR